MTPSKWPKSMAFKSGGDPKHLLLGMIDPPSTLPENKWILPGSLSVRRGTLARAPKGSFFLASFFSGELLNFRGVAHENKPSQGN